jgi:hypothetical protein
MTAKLARRVQINRSLKLTIGVRLMHRWFGSVAKTDQIEAGA